MGRARGLALRCRGRCPPLALRGPCVRTRGPARSQRRLSCISGSTAVRNPDPRGGDHRVGAVVPTGLSCAAAQVQGARRIRSRIPIFGSVFWGVGRRVRRPAHRTICGNPSGGDPRGGFGTNGRVLKFESSACVPSAYCHDIAQSKAHVFECRLARGPKDGSKGQLVAAPAKRAHQTSTG